MKKNTITMYIIISVLVFHLYIRTVMVFTDLFVMNWIDDIVVLFLLLLLPFMSQFKIRRNVLNLPLCVFLGIFLFSTLINEIAYDVAMMQLRSYLLYIVMYYFILYSDISDGNVVTIFKVLLVFSLPIVLTSFVEYYLQAPIIPIEKLYKTYDLVSALKTGFRPTTLIGNPIDFGNLLVFIILILTVAELSNASFLLGNRRANWIYGVVCVSALFLSASKGPFIALFLPIVLYLGYRHNLHIKRIFIYGSILIVAISITGHQLLSRFAVFFEQGGALVHGYRAIWLKASYDIFLDNPLIGAGPGTFGGWVSVHYEYSPLWRQYGVSPYGISSIDMFWPHVWAELGSLGLVSFSLFFLIPWIQFTRMLRTQTSSNPSLVMYILLLNVLLIPAIFILCFFNSSFEMQLVQSYYFIILALSMKVISNRNAQSGDIYA